VLSKAPQVDQPLKTVKRRPAGLGYRGNNFGIPPRHLPLLLHRAALVQHQITFKEVWEISAWMTLTYNECTDGSDARLNLLK